MLEPAAAGHSLPNANCLALSRLVSFRLRLDDSFIADLCSSVSQQRTVKASSKGVLGTIHKALGDLFQLFLAELPRHWVIHSPAADHDLSKGQMSGEVLPEVR